jgi:hypothetical protein
MQTTALFYATIDGLGGIAFMLGDVHIFAPTNDPHHLYPVPAARVHRTGHVTEPAMIAVITADIEARFATGGLVACPL